MRGKTWVSLGIISFLLLDQVVKGWMQSWLSLERPVSGIPGLVQWNLTYNTGAAFSLMNRHPEVLIWITLIIFLSLGLYCYTRPRLTQTEILGYALVLGGALGNLIDRFRLGKVVDFIDVTFINYPVFNLADTFITCGVGLLLIMQLKDASRTQNEKVDG